MITDLIKRSVSTALKLPFSIAWDCISLGNMGEGASTTKVLREHKRQKETDEMMQILRRINSGGR